MPTNFPAFNTIALACFIGDRKNPVIAALASLDCIIPEPGGRLLRDKYDLVLFAAFRSSNDQLTILNLIWKGLLPSIKPFKKSRISSGVN
jgi:hypothetical protein